MHPPCQHNDNPASEDLTKTAAHPLRIEQSIRCAILAREPLQKTRRRSWETPPLFFQAQSLLGRTTHLGRGPQTAPHVLRHVFTVAFCAPVRTTTVLQALQAWLSRVSAHGLMTLASSPPLAVRIAAKTNLRDRCHRHAQRADDQATC